MKIISMIVVGFLIMIAACSNDLPTSDSTAILPPTGQDFVFSSTRWGNHLGSDIKDVAIVNENEIWGVGSILLGDTLYDGRGHPSDPFGMVKWNGESWSIKRVYHYDEMNQVYSDLSPYSICITKDDKIFLGAGFLWSWNDERGIAEELINRREVWEHNAGIYKVWGEYSNDIWGCGWGGALVHWNGSRWKRIDISPDLEFLDIYGRYSIKNLASEIYIIGFTENSYKPRIFYVNSMDFTPVEITPDSITRPMYSIWTNGEKSYLGGFGLYYKEGAPESDSTWNDLLEDTLITDCAIYDISSSSENDIVMAGGIGEILHYNGRIWKRYLEQTHLSGNYLTTAIKGNIIVAGGIDNRQAIITIGKRYNYLED